MSRWGKKERVVIDWDAESLDVAVNQAREDWQHARHLVEISEPDGGLEDVIYYLHVTEKRYMYLLAQAKRERHRKHA
ncbi:MULTISPECIES: DUF2508 family protein [Brevibacillus]|uniref:DUF2508 domain-containing protein n=1 Tax=Brevibacillus parabrevis TaxID=54914 RepID=A0A4Y3PHM3_BREPA|nr:MULTISPECIES: DUF2508 family protein [Brevibacillus]NRQ56561.1 DUF2508 family protein [Brevibacillus sp. HD1.4A]KZE46620.1 hypothetical protein AV540_21960 [Brevibacillus parabrevis]MBU8716001.1 YaaL family protein [Brevibacillus parabrevis]MDR5002648.1 DUF2508 family protein [Brevibacillus parabrevis]MED2256959.1 DUF2508 family protein [Brevibacillus parabrevis]